MDRIHQPPITLRYNCMCGDSRIYRLMMKFKDPESESKFVYRCDNCKKQKVVDNDLNDLEARAVSFGEGIKFKDSRKDDRD